MKKEAHSLLTSALIQVALWPLMVFFIPATGPYSFRAESSDISSVNTLNNMTLDLQPFTSIPLKRFLKAAQNTKMDESEKKHLSFQEHRNSILKCKREARAEDAQEKSSQTNPVFKAVQNSHLSLFTIY